MKAKFLVGTVDKSQLIRTDSACRDLIDEAKNYLLLPQERGHMQGPRLGSKLRIVYCISYTYIAH